MQSAPPLAYRLLIRLLAPLLLAYTLWRAHKDGGRSYFMQRLCIGQDKPAITDNTERIWIHAASVGEVFTVLPLIRANRSPLLVTTMSPTGAAVLDKQRLPHVRHHYLPIDFPGACSRFFEQARISRGWIVETEIWPWLYACAKQHSIPLTIINARLSDRTSKRAKGFMAIAFRQALEHVRILARSESDAARFVALGAEPSSISVLGNLKYANDQKPDSQRQNEPPIARPYFLAASTHADEEEQLALAWHELQQRQDTQQLLVLVPRHPERGPAIQKLLESHGISASLRSRHEPPAAEAYIYIADTLGELHAWYACATACFIGGSLIERGGHNMLEAARLGCAMIVGPHTFNFADVVQLLVDQQALTVVDTADEVVEWLTDIAADETRRVLMTQRAREQARLSEGVLDAYISALG